MGKIIVTVDGQEIGETSTNEVVAGSPIPDMEIYRDVMNTFQLHDTTVGVVVGTMYMFPKGTTVEQAEEIVKSMRNG